MCSALTGRHLRRRNILIEQLQRITCFLNQLRERVLTYLPLENYNIWFGSNAQNVRPPEDSEGMNGDRWTDRKPHHLR